MIARVFPRKTNASPTDALAFFGQPTIENIADCIKADVAEVHISVTFTWDLERAEDLYYAWQILGVPVEVGGPAFDDRMGDFTPGLYLRDGKDIPKIHPTQKPVNVLKRLIEVFTDPGDVVIDPCAGSATTLRAAYELGRNAYGFEIDKNFYRAAQEQMLAPLFEKPAQITMEEVTR
mgnify:CR=1 FL=1